MSEIELAMDVTATPLAGRQVRNWLREVLPERLRDRCRPAERLEQLVHDLVWLVSELVENSVRHTTTTRVGVRVHLRVPGGPDQICVEVLDEGPGLPEQPAEPAAPPHRHGLDMMRVLGATLTPICRQGLNGVAAILALPAPHLDELSARDL